MKTKKLKKGKVIETGALLEDFNSKFDLVAEQTSQIPEIKSVLKSHSETLGYLYEQTSQIPEIKNQVNNLVEDMGIVKIDLEFIKGALKKKVDVDEFTALEHRVVSLESRLR